jgi:hypothetical protein
VLVAVLQRPGWTHLAGDARTTSLKFMEVLVYWAIFIVVLIIIDRTL